MSKKNKIIRISLIVFFSLLLIVGLIIFIIHKKNENNKPTVIPSDEPEIPEIKEDFNTASFKLIKKYSEYINFDTIIEFYKAWENAGIFDKCGAAIIPCNFKIFKKEEAQLYINKLQSIIDQMGE